jgi:hypothetical protein
VLLCISCSLALLPSLQSVLFLSSAFLLSLLFSTSLSSPPCYPTLSLSLSKHTHSKIAFRALLAVPPPLPRQCDLWIRPWH